MFLKSLFVLSLLVALSGCQTNNELDEVAKQLKDHLPEGVSFNTSALPNEEQASEAFHQKCIKNANEDVYLEVKNARGDFEKCVRALVDMEELNKEMELAKPTGDLDTVFKKYCAKTPEFKNCIYAFTGKVELCLSEKERNNMHIVHNITDSLADFICFKEGDRIALFIAEGGPQCIESKQTQVQDCFNRTLGSSLDTSNVDINNIPDIVFDKGQCEKMTQLQLCVVKELENCDEPTPANIADSLFKFVKQVTPCKDYKFETEKVGPLTDGAVKTSMALTSVLLIAGTFLLV